MSMKLETERLIMRPLTMDDLDDVAAMNNDARVMEFFPTTLTREESAGFIKKLMAHQKAHGFSLCALHLKQGNAFCGFTGLLKAEFDAPFTPAVEIGLRFAHAAWGKGLGPEAARACLAFGFDTLGLSEIVSFTAAQNFRSVRVMEKIGMRRDTQGDFDHPNLAPGHRLRRHVLYRLRRDEWSVSTQ